MTQQELLSWLSELSTHEISKVLTNPNGYLTKHLASRIVDKADIFQSYFVTSLDDREQRWQFHPNEVEDLEEMRQRLDTWWNELPQDARDALKNHQAGTVPGMYRDAVEAFGPEVRLDSGGRDLREPFILPKLIRGYLKLIPPAAE
jgi:hypothetical protein